MSRPLNDDGTVPLKRRLQVTMRVVERNNTLLEVSRDIKPQWQQVTDEDMSDCSTAAPLSPEDLVEPCARAIAADAGPAILAMAQELILKVHAGA